MTLFEKLITNPDGGSRMRSPLVMAVVAIALLFSIPYEIVTDSIQTGKSSNRTLIHFSDHPMLFILWIIFTFVLAILLLREAYKRYLRNND